MNKAEQEKITDRERGKEKRESERERDKRKKTVIYFHIILDDNKIKYSME